MNAMKTSSAHTRIALRIALRKKKAAQPAQIGAMMDHRRVADVYVPVELTLSSGISCSSAAPPGRGDPSSRSVLLRARCASAAARSTTAPLRGSFTGSLSRFPNTPSKKCSGGRVPTEMPLVLPPPPPLFSLSFCCCRFLSLACCRCSLMYWCSGSDSFESGGASHDAG